MWCVVLNLTWTFYHCQAVWERNEHVGGENQTFGQEDTCSISQTGATSERASHQSQCNLPAQACSRGSAQQAQVCTAYALLNDCLKSKGYYMGNGNSWSMCNTFYTQSHSVSFYPLVIACCFLILSLSPLLLLFLSFLRCPPWTE